MEAVSEEAMASGSLLPSSLLLSVADDLVRVFQSLITMLSDFYEVNVSSGPSLRSCMASMEVVQLTCHELHQKLAVLWPCEKKFVAVLGRTGCGKSTLLNLLLSMMCSSGDTYTQGIRADSVRAVLRDTARFHGVSTRGSPIIAQDQAEDASEILQVLPNDPHWGNEYIQDDLLVSEQLSFKGILGICCAQDRPLYMSKHVPHYDTCPFILQNGRMGDAGTTKATSIEYGPKFVGHIRWMTRKKLRKKLRDLRQALDYSERTTMEEQSLAELKEFWFCVRQLVNLPSTAERPTEEQINMVIDELWTKRRLLDKEEVIQTNTTQGCTIDRVFVREGIKEKFQQQLGKFIEDLRIEVPVSSFEGGISLLDLPGTNDPRVLHQRETRDAIDRTSLILLVLDKSVMDVQTQESLAESLLLERMLMDQTASCSLVVVGIAEKDTKKGQSPKDLLAGFDPKKTILRTLKKVLLKIASRLCKSKRIQKDHALNRIESLFTSSITLVPVLPFLCASLHLSLSNPKLHQAFCQSEGRYRCPLLMSKEEIREGCMETNIPHLLEKVHSVRVPPAKEELLNFITSTMDGLRLLTQINVLDSSYVGFLKWQRDQAVSVAAEELCANSEPVVNIQFVKDMLDQCADECRLSPNDIEELCNTLGEEILSQLQTGRFPLGPFILHGFCPEGIGQNANKLISSVDEESKCFTDKAFVYLCSLRGDAASVDANFDKLEGESLVLALGLLHQLDCKWKLSLQRLRAKCFCGGIDGGLLGQVRGALRKAYYGALRHLSKELKQRSKSKKFSEMLRMVLESNELGVYAAKVAKAEVENAVNVFWKIICDSTSSEMQFLWRSWQADIKDLGESALKSSHIYKEVTGRPDVLDKVESGDERLKLFQEKLRGKVQELESLQRCLNEPYSQTERVLEYGYSLLRSVSNSCAADVLNCDRQLGTADEADQASIKQPNQGGDGAARCAPTTSILRESSHCLASKQTVHSDCISPRNLTGAASSGVNIGRFGSFIGRKSRKAQVLSESESHKLQKKESNANQSWK